LKKETPRWKQRGVFYGGGYDWLNVGLCYLSRIYELSLSKRDGFFSTWLLNGVNDENGGVVRYCNAFNFHRAGEI
jgi:hypothetical protein